MPVRNLQREAEEYLKSLKLQGKLADQYSKAVAEYADNIKLGVTPVAPEWKSVEEQRGDVIKQRQIAFDNLKTIMDGNEAKRSLDRLGDNEVWDLNSNWGNFTSELKGRKNVDATFFYNFWDRFVQKQRSTADTGIVIPLTEEGLEGKLDDLATVLERQIGSKLSNKFDQLKSFVEGLDAQSRNAIINELTEATKSGDKRDVQRVLETLEELKTKAATGEELGSVLKEVKGIKGIYKRSLIPPEPVLDKMSVPNLIAMARDLGIVYVRNNKGNRVNLNTDSVKGNVSKDVLIRAIRKLAEGEEEGDEESEESKGRYVGKPFEVRVPRGYNLSPDYEELYALLYSTPHEQLVRLINGNEDVLDEAQRTFSLKGKPSATAWKNVSKENLAVFLLTQVKLGMLTEEEIEGLPRNIDLEEHPPVFKEGSEFEGPDLDKAATKVGALFRGRRIRQEKAKLDEATSKIQSAFRGYRVRKVRKEEAIANEASTKLQSVFRGYAQRKQFPAEKTERERARHEFEDISNEIDKLPEGPSKAEIRNLFRSYRTSFYNRLKIPKAGETQEQYQQRQLENLEVQRERQALLTALHRALALSRGGAGADIPALQAEGNALRPQLRDLNDRIGQLNADVQRRVGDWRAKKTESKQLQTQFTALQARFAVINRQLRAAGEPELAGFGLRSINTSATTTRSFLPATGRKVVGRGIAPQPQEKYKQFGRYIIHIPSLKKGTLNVKYPSLAAIPSMPQRMISEDLTDFVLDLLDHEEMSDRLYQKLNDQDRKVFDRLAIAAQVNETLGIKPDLESDREEMKRFELVRGEVLSGQNSPDVLRELKQFTVKFLAEGRITKQAGLDLLTAISCL